MFIWGAMATGAAFSKGYSDSAIFRIFIGLAEVGFKPCVIYYFATFCTKVRGRRWGYYRGPGELLASLL
jgi:hypothetical protein